MIVFAFSADLLWMLRENIAARVSNLHHKVPGKVLRKKILGENLGSFVILDSEQQMCGLLAERISPKFHY